MASALIRERSWVEIDLAAFRSNLQALKKFLAPAQGFIQIVKADAYGHGAFQISQMAIAEGAVALGVANLEEGKLLRIQGCQAPILILSPSLENEIPGIIEHGLTPTLPDKDFATRLNDQAASRNIRLKVQLKLDSGMHRSGALEKEFAALWKLCQTLSNLEVEGVFSHFASGESDLEFSREQEAGFQRILNKYGISVPITHLANSSALVNGLGGSANLCRLGILSYGIHTHPSQAKKITLRPVMTFKSIVTQLKNLPKGGGVGYNLTWKAPRRTRLAVVPVGYADGYDFLLSNQGVVSIREKLCPVIGRVSMDMLTIDVTDLPDVHTGDEVILLGNSAPELRAENLAQKYGGSAYELLCQVGRRAKRYYYEGNKLVTSSPLSRRDFVSSDFTDSKLSQIIQSAIAQRLDSAEIGELISREILRVFFYNKDREILYRRDFNHHISFEESGIKDCWRAFTTLSFAKVLQNDYFIVACANSEQALKAYFKRRDVEYRWLVDSNFQLDPESFRVSSVRVDGLELETRVQVRNNCLEVRCSHPGLKGLIGTEVGFRIDTSTLYPKYSHQLSVFITELTRGVKISFTHPASLASLDCVPVFSGQNKYPRITTSKNTITVTTKAGEWVFPQSGVVFAY
ncbi:MAG: alanine racemase [Candidatus Syntrophosphaera sp.]|nr:alanine racemase [Candidatus Syntrophosphaera sp.]